METFDIATGEMPVHNHISSMFNKNNENADAGYYPAGYLSASVLKWSSTAFKTAGGSTGDPCGITRDAGSGNSHNNLTPFVVIHLYIRTA